MRNYFSLFSFSLTSINNLCIPTVSVYLFISLPLDDSDHVFGIFSTQNASNVTGLDSRDIQMRHLEK